MTLPSSLSVSAGLLAALLLAPLLAPPAQAQVPFLTAQDQPVRVGLTPVVQQVDDGGQVVTQWSSTLDLRLPLGDRWQATARLQAAQTDTDAGTQVRGLDDASLGVLYALPVGDGSLVGRVDVGIPVGKDELTAEELSATRFTSRPFYDYRLGSFGAGGSVTPRLTYALPVAERVVVGVGAAYQILGSYRPLARMSRSYDPGNGVEVFGGLDVQVARSSILAFDARYARYGTARAGGVDRLQSGSSYSGTLQYTYQAGFRVLRVSATVQKWDESTIRPFVVGPDAVSVSSQQQLVPSRAQLAVRYQQRFGDRLSVLVRSGGAYYRATAVDDRKRVAQLSVYPSFALSDAWILTPFVSGSAGDFLAYSAGLRTEVRF